MRKNLCGIVVCMLCFACLFEACHSSAVVPNLSADELFARGKMRFDDEDYLDAIDDLKALTVQYPGSAVADDAQYYLGECHFERGEYLLAAYEYETLRRSMPSSSFAAVAQYKIGLCYYMLSPNAPLDQVNTKKAIDQFQTFLEYFPTHELAQDAERKIAELNERLAKKDYETASLYMKMEYYKAATLYFDYVLEQYHDTEYAERSLVGKIRALVARNKYADAKVEIDKFHTRYPESQYGATIQSIEADVNSHLSTDSDGHDTPASASTELAK